MASNLVIVESPAKAKTIQKYLGKDFSVMSSYGHIRDLCDKGMAIDIENNFTPEYCVSKDKAALVKDLKKAAKAADKVWLASDEDREGEAIAWHLFESLNLTEEKTERIVFNEVTKSAILRAVENPRKINKELVDAQQARRVLDRLVGYELSPVLWKSIQRGLSAGRVQSVAVRLIVEKEREIEAHVPTTSFKVSGLFSDDKISFKAELAKNLQEEESQKFLEQCVGAEYKVESVEKRPGKRSPAAPFTTSTLQQEASRKLGFSVSQTMTLAQRLYEAGHITYMRTDSFNLSNDALSGIAAHVESQYGENYHQARKFNLKSKGAQEAHEAIRPTNFAMAGAGADDRQKKLYDLIYKRTIASQMAEAKLENTTIKISNTKAPDAQMFTARGQVITFDGFIRVYQEGSDEENSEQIDGQLPAVVEGDLLRSDEITATERFTKHAPRYTEASLVKKLEELGIGRPSTYAPTISTVQKRKYVIKESLEGNSREYKVYSATNKGVAKKIDTENYGADKNKLFPTDIGKVVTDFLTEHYGLIMDYQFTAKAEQNFDTVAVGQIGWQDSIKEFYSEFHPLIENAPQNARASRLLGEEPDTGEPIYVKLARYGFVFQFGDGDEETKPRFKKLPHGVGFYDATLEMALRKEVLPRTVGSYQDMEVKANIGRYGPYVMWNKKFFSLTEDTPEEVSIEQAVAIIETKLKEDSNNIIAEFTEEPVIQILKGRYGPYIKSDGKNFKIPKDKEPESLDRGACEELIAAGPSKRRAKRK
ncbi:MAG: DNA topoisomerase I [Flavobacteriales bacterium]|nr:DNA topoisomerase I [Flavobacteriales bacterium]